MNQLPLSKNQQIKNCLLALSLWAEVSPRAVNLSDWKCGTQACFGGHLVTWPEFKALGVEPGSDRHPYPLLPREDIWLPSVLAKYLFGDWNLFNARDEKTDGEESLEELAKGRYKLSDHRLVVRRLERQIERLSS